MFSIFTLKYCNARIGMLVVVRPFIYICFCFSRNENFNAMVVMLATSQVNVT